MTEEFDHLRRSRARAYLESVRAERVKVDALRDELAVERESMGPKGIRFDKLGGGLVGVRGRDPRRSVAP